MNQTGAASAVAGYALSMKYSKAYVSTVRKRKMELFNQIRMAIWYVSLRRQQKLLKRWAKSDNEDTSIMALMLLSFFDTEEMDDGDE